MSLFAYAFRPQWMLRVGIFRMGVIMMVIMGMAMPVIMRMAMIMMVVMAHVQPTFACAVGIAQLAVGDV